MFPPTETALPMTFPPRLIAPVVTLTPSLAAPPPRSITVLSTLPAPLTAPHAMLIGNVPHTSARAGAGVGISRNPTSTRHSPQTASRRRAALSSQGTREPPEARDLTDERRRSRSARLIGRWSGTGRCLRDLTLLSPLRAGPRHRNVGELPCERQRPHSSCADL